MVFCTKLWDIAQNLKIQVKKKKGKVVSVDVLVDPTADADIGKIKEFEKLQNQWCM